MKRVCKSSCWLAVLFTASSILAQTITVDLKNGDRITGNLISEGANTNVLVLSNAWAARLAIPFSEITNRFTHTNVALIAAATNTANTNITNAVAFAKKVASTNSLFTSRYLKYWHGDLQAGVDLTFGERNRQVYNGRAKLTYARNRFKAIIDYDTTYGRSQKEEEIEGTGLTRTVSVTDANRMFGSVKAEYDLTKKWYVYNLGGAGYDEIRKIDLRYEVGPGLGYRLINVTNLLVTIEGGSNYQYEEHTDGTEISTFNLRLAQAAAWKITPRLTWDERFEYTPRYEDPADYRIRFETNVRYALLQNVFLNLSVLDIYDSDAAPGVEKNDLQIRSSVGVKF
jgi:hypothetical protein